MPFALLFIVLIFFPINSQAADDSLGNFNKSIIGVYTSSKACENTISGPKEYIAVINEYFSKLYPDGAGYWVIPPTTNYIDNASDCIRIIQARLSDYQNAYNNYNSNYPNRHPVPILIAHRWESTHYKIAQEQPTKSYIPTKKADQRFISNISK